MAPSGNLGSVNIVAPAEQRQLQQQQRQHGPAHAHVCITYVDPPPTCVQTKIPYLFERFNVPVHSYQATYFYVSRKALFAHMSSTSLRVFVSPFRSAFIVVHSSGKHWTRGPYEKSGARRRILLLSTGQKKAAQVFVTNCRHACCIVKA